MIFAYLCFVTIINNQHYFLPEFIIDIILQQWVTIKGAHADNALCVSVCQVLKEHNPASIPHYICVNRKSSGGKRFDGYGKKDREYQNVMRKISRIKAMIAAYTLDDILDSTKEGMDTKVNRARE